MSERIMGSNFLPSQINRTLYFILFYLFTILFFLHIKGTIIFKSLKHKAFGK
jgi:hypothetical protein